ncbi:hypothetical protein ACHHYP_08298 [Achlya hypogyna]|uniref:Uncharacterized protein n=1 Tax=Achlya hypogyna TaxID=1202772 RepID=A0A1V9ZKT2_ACHHY|nr:hypothetical protein ACHHYP_08298 [Achlya hypogyna]
MADPEISAADAAMLYDIISSPGRGPKVHDERTRSAYHHGSMMSLLSPLTKPVPACSKRRRKKSLAQLNETAEQREERLLKDRVRKQQSKEKFQSEIDELKTTAEALSVTLAERKRKASTVSQWKLAAQAEKDRCNDAMRTRTTLFNQVVHEIEKAVLFKSLNWRETEGDMIIDPKRDPWQLHTLSSTHHGDHVLALAEFQREKVTPALFAKFLDSASGGMFNIVLDAAGQDIAFLEQRKFGLIQGSPAEIAHTIYDAFSTTTGEGREVTPAAFYGKDLVLATFPWGGVRRRICMQLHRDGDRVFLMHRSILFDETLDHKIAEHVATWWCFEPVAEDPTLCRLRGYSQVALETTPASASHDYAVFMKRSTENEVRVNNLLSSRFKCLALN